MSATLRPGVQEPDINKPHGRLAHARQLKYPSASEAARSLQMPVPTYSAHENGHRNFLDGQADYYGRHFGVRSEWLLHGTGSMERGEDQAGATTVNIASAQRMAVGNPLLIAYDVYRSPTGFRPNPAPSDSVFSLAPVRDANKYVPELIPTTDENISTSGERAQRRIRNQFSRLPPQFIYTLRDFWIFPLDDIQADYIVCFKLSDSQIYTRGSKIFVDVEKNNIVDSGIYCFRSQNEIVILVVKIPKMTNNTGSIFPDEDESSNREASAGDRRVLVRRSRQERFTEYSLESLRARCVGKVIAVVFAIDMADGLSGDLFKEDE